LAISKQIENKEQEIKQEQLEDIAGGVPFALHEEPPPPVNKPSNHPPAPFP